MNEIYWCGWLRQLLEEKASQKTEQNKVSKIAQKLLAQKSGVVWWFYIIIGVLCLGIFKVSPNQAGHYSAYGAYYYVHTGEANNYHTEYLERVKRLSGQAKNVHLPAYKYTPWFLCMGDITEDAKDERNRALAMWYGKDSVTVLSED